MSYLDPIRKDLEEAMPIEGNPAHIALPCFMLLFFAMAYAMHFWVHSATGKTPDPGYEWSSLVFSLSILGGYTIAAIVVVLRDGLPRTMRRLRDFLRAYWCRNVVGYVIALHGKEDGGFEPKVVRRNKDWMGGWSRGLLVVPLGGWFHRGGYWLGTRRVCDVRLDCLNLPSGRLDVRARIRRTTITLPAASLMDLMHAVHSESNFPLDGIRQLSWGKIVHRAQKCLDRQTRTAQQSQEKATELSKNAFAWSQAHARLINAIMETKRFQYSKEAESCLMHALKGIVYLIPANYPSWKDWEEKLERLEARIAKREAKSKPDITEGTR